MEVTYETARCWEKNFPLYNKRFDPSEGYIGDNQLAVTYCSVAKKFTVATITVFAAVCSTIICWWRTLIDRWSVTWAAISTTAHTRGWPGWHIKPQSINVCKKRSRDISPGWRSTGVLSSQCSSVTAYEKKKIAWGLFYLCRIVLVLTTDIIFSEYFLWLNLKVVRNWRCHITYTLSSGLSLRFFSSCNQWSFTWNSSQSISTVSFSFPLWKT